MHNPSRKSPDRSGKKKTAGTQPRPNSKQTGNQTPGETKKLPGPRALGARSNKMAQADQVRFLGKSPPGKTGPQTGQGPRRRNQNGKSPQNGRPQQRAGNGRSEGGQPGRRRQPERITANLAHVDWEKVWTDRSGIKAAVARILNHMEHFINLMKDADPRERLERWNSEYQRVGVIRRTPPTMTVSNDSFTAKLLSNPHRAEMEVLRIRPEGPVWVQVILSRERQDTIRGYMKYLQA